MNGHDHVANQTKPYQSTADELEEKTRRFWNLSSIWNGRLDERLSCEKALGITRDLATFMNPYRPLYRSVLQTEDEIIRNKKRRKPEQNEPSTILLLTHRAK